jgi:hypothetical protein
VEINSTWKKEIIMKRRTIAKTFTNAAVTAIALGVAQAAKAEQP